MSAHESHSQALGPCSPTSNNFTPFQDLPREIRIMIWKAAFETRRLLLRTNRARIPLDALTGRFLLVNWEANLEFNMAYRLMFRDQNSTNGMLVNPKNDTLHFHSGLRGFELFVTKYPRDMAMIRHVEINPGHDSQEKSPWQRINLCCLSSIRTITVSSLRHSEQYIPRGTLSTVANEYEFETRDQATIRTLEMLRISLAFSKEQAPPDLSCPSPILAGVFSGKSKYHGHPIYFQSNKDLSHASYGRLKSDILATQSEPLRIKWLAKDHAWAPVNIAANDSRILPGIFAAIVSARIMITGKTRGVAWERRCRKAVAGDPDYPVSRYDYYDVACMTVNWGVVNGNAQLQLINNLIEHLRDVQENPLVGLAATVDGELLRLHEHLGDVRGNPLVITNVEVEFLRLREHLRDVREDYLVGLAATVDGEFLRLHEFCTVCQE